jgi:hypothetical protein
VAVRVVFAVAADGEVGMMVGRDFVRVVIDDNERVAMGVNGAAPPEFKRVEGKSYFVRERDGAIIDANGYFGTVENADRFVKNGEKVAMVNGLPQEGMEPALDLQEAQGINELLPPTPFGSLRRQNIPQPKPLATIKPKRGNPPNESPGR